MVMALVAASAAAQTNPLWHEKKVKNYLPHMTWPEVEDLLTRTDMVLIPVGAIEQHGRQLPMGTDILSGIERGKLIAQQTDVLVAPVLMAGNSPYHMGFPGTISLSAETIQSVIFEAAQSLMRHGFRRFLILNAHGGNRATSRFLVDRINHETEAIAVELGEASAPFRKGTREPPSPVFDRHAGVSETSRGLYLFPDLVDMDAAQKTALTLPPHLEKMLPDVIAGEPTSLRLFLAEGLKAESTGKKTSAREMSTTGVWGVRDLSDANVERGRRLTEAAVDAAVQFIERWKELRPMNP
jgi:creatinine amidohydrolase